MVKINRRQFILLSAAGAGAALVGNQLGKRTISSQPLPESSVNLVPLYQSSNGLLELDLEAREHLVNLGANQAYLLTYNGQVPAPRLEAKPGDKVRINFTNNLSQPTNLHYHGLHIPLQAMPITFFCVLTQEKSLLTNSRLPKIKQRAHFGIIPIYTV